MTVNDWNSKVIVEPQFQRPGLEFTIPVRTAVAKSEVPLANAGCCVTRIFHELTSLWDIPLICLRFRNINATLLSHNASHLERISLECVSYQLFSIDSII